MQIPSGGRVSALAASLAPNRFAPVARPDPSGTMPAIRYDRHGGPEALQWFPEHPKPQRPRGQSLIRIHAAGLNPVDYKMRQYTIPRVLFPLPKIPGTDFAGEVVESDVASAFQPGDRVFGMMPLLGTPWGTCAGFVTIADRFLAKLPNAIRYTEGAAMPLVALTVIQSLSRATRKFREPTAGKTILIQAGSGGLGTFAIQYCARVLKMTVATTCSTKNLGLVRSLGAHQAIDYTKTAFDQQDQQYDFIFDPLGHRFAKRTLASGILRRGGHYLHIAGSDWPPTDNRSLIPEARPTGVLAKLARQFSCNALARFGLRRSRYHLIFVHPDGGQLRRLSEPLADQRIRPLIDRTFPLRDTADAHRCLQQGHTRGKIVIEIGEGQ